MGLLLLLLDMPYKVSCLSFNVFAVSEPKRVVTTFKLAAVVTVILYNSSQTDTELVPLGFLDTD